MFHLARFAWPHILGAGESGFSSVRGRAGLPACLSPGAATLLPHWLSAAPIPSMYVLGGGKKERIVAIDE